MRQCVRNLYGRLGLQLDIAMRHEPVPLGSRGHYHLPLRMRARLGGQLADEPRERGILGAPSVHGDALRGGLPVRGAKRAAGGSARSAGGLLYWQTQ